jgi:hypothetical protein
VIESERREKSKLFLRVFEDRASDLDGEVVLSWNEIQMMDFFSTKKRRYPF